MLRSTALDITIGVIVRIVHLPGAGGIAFKAVVRWAAVDVGDEVVVGQGVRGAREGDGVVEREPAGEADHGVAEADKGAAEGVERRPGAVARRELHEHLLRELGWGPRGPRHLREDCSFHGERQRRRSVVICSILLFVTSCSSRGGCSGRKPLVCPFINASILGSINMALERAEFDDFELVNRHEANLSPEDLAKIQKWLQPTNHTGVSSEFRRHLASQAPGTSNWICDTLKFKQWQTSENHGSLWIKGVPGAGKSVLAASMVDHLKRDSENPVLYFFFRYIIAANRTSRSLVRDWLAQLLPYSSRLQALLQPLSSNELENVSDEQLWGHLLAGLSSVQNAYCVVDALDEMQLDSKFLQRLNSLTGFRPGSVKLLMTSRPKEYLQSSLRDTSTVHISLESDAVGKDITVFVSHRLRTALPGADHEELRGSLASCWGKEDGHRGIRWHFGPK
ncbi:hypothetical protein V500_02997, partial [Pseudogymnoascus sp. VKM F-4518 (FW-2643)]